MFRTILCLALLVTIADAAPKQQLDYADFWNVGGLTHADTVQSAKKKWGDKGTIGKFAGDPQVEYAKGPSILFRKDGGIQITISDYQSDYITAFPSAATSLLGQSCAEAGARLAFYKKPVPNYLTCKKYDKTNWLLDVTLMCRTHVSMVTIVWYPLPKPDKPYDEAHCN